MRFVCHIHFPSLVAYVSACAACSGSVAKEPPSNVAPPSNSTSEDSSSSRSQTSDASPPPEGSAPDAGTDFVAPNQVDVGTPAVGDAGAVGPTYPCGDAGLQCTCPTTEFPAAPYNDAGQQETFASSPPPGPVTPYSNTMEFDALAVGRWWRVAGQGEIACEEIGVEITASHTFVPLVTASDGSLQPVSLLAQGFDLQFDGGTPVIPSNNPPVFFDAGSGPGTGMQLNIEPWLANYVKIR